MRQVAKQTILVICFAFLIPAAGYGSYKAVNLAFDLAVNYQTKNDPAVKICEIIGQRKLTRKFEEYNRIRHKITDNHVSINYETISFGLEPISGTFDCIFEISESGVWEFPAIDIPKLKDLPPECKILSQPEDQDAVIEKMVAEVGKEQVKALLQHCISITENRVDKYRTALSNGVDSLTELIIPLGETGYYPIPKNKTALRLP